MHKNIPELQVMEEDKIDSEIYNFFTKMNTMINIKPILIIIIIATALNGYSQSFPTGGYQGGTHGNIKYTLWSGAVDDDWAEPGNWCPAVVPDADEAVVIPSAAPVMPEVKSEGLSCKSLNLEPGAAITIKPGYTLTVNGVEVE
jgi:hypothetical protein